MSNGNGATRLFAERFLRHPRTVGSILPSSRFLAQRICDPVRWESGVRVAEFGPGTGPFTEEIRRRLPDEGRYLAIERDPVFHGILAERFPDLDIACDGVENLMTIAEDRGVLPFDHIISGIPFASLDPAVTKQIIRSAHEALREGGAFTTFQYLHSYAFHSARQFRRRMRSMFGPLVSRAVEMRNVPPAFVFTWRKNGS